MAEKQIAESFEQAMGELEQIVQQLQNGNIPLEQALASFKRGIELSQYCQNTLKEAEKTIQELQNSTSIEDNGGN